MENINCPACHTPLLITLSEVCTAPESGSAAADVPAPPAASSKPKPAPAKPKMQTAFERRRLQLIDTLSEWFTDDPSLVWPGYEEPKEIYGRFIAWHLEKYGIDLSEKGITKNLVSKALSEMGSQWIKTRTGRVYSVPPQFRPEGMPALLDHPDDAAVPLAPAAGGESAAEVPAPASPPQDPALVPDLHPTSTAAVEAPAGIPVAVDPGSVTVDEAGSVSFTGTLPPEVAANLPADNPPAVSIEPERHLSVVRPSSTPLQSTLEVVQQKAHDEAMATGIAAMHDARTRLVSLPEEPVAAAGPIFERLGTTSDSVVLSSKLADKGPVGSPTRWRLMIRVPDELQAQSAAPDDLHCDSLFDEKLPGHMVRSGEVMVRPVSEPDRGLWYLEASIVDKPRPSAEPEPAPEPDPVEPAEEGWFEADAEETAAVLPAPEAPAPEDSVADGLIESGEAIDPAAIPEPEPAPIPAADDPALAALARRRHAAGLAAALLPDDVLDPGDWG